jgi:hypothetical protein
MCLPPKALSDLHQQAHQRIPSEPPHPEFPAPMKGARESRELASPNWRVSGIAGTFQSANERPQHGDATVYCRRFAGGLLLSAALHTATAAEQRWEVVAQSDDGPVSVERNSIVGPPDRRMIWMRVSYATPQADMPKPYRSIATRVLVDCYRNRSANREFVVYSGPDGSGEIVFSLTTTDADLQWSDTRERTVVAPVVKAACRGIRRAASRAV